MTSIREFLTHDHRQCDDFLALAEQAAGKQAGAELRAAFALFQQRTLSHFQAEESILFPAFEAATGMTGGPTAMMRMEHEQMRALLRAAGQALEQDDVDEYLGQVDTLIMMMQQHNMKEENVLYPMCDQHLAAECAALLAQIAPVLKAA